VPDEALRLGLVRIRPGWTGDAELVAGPDPPAATGGPAGDCEAEPVGPATCRVDGVGSVDLLDDGAFPE
jgi:hypothetical protein